MNLIRNSIIVACTALFPQVALLGQDTPANKAENARLTALGEQLVYQERLGRAAAEVAKNANVLTAVIG